MDLLPEAFHDTRKRLGPFVALSIGILIMLLIPPQAGLINRLGGYPSSGLRRTGPSSGLRHTGCDTPAPTMKGPGKNPGAFTQLAGYAH